MSDTEKTARPVGFGLVLAGMCFFFNPAFAVVDVLPDFIGCLLIFFGLSRVACVSRPMAEARTAFLKLFLVSFVKDLFVLAIFGMSTDLERPTSLLIAAFTGAVLWLYFAIAAFRALFDGFYALGVANDCAPLYKARPRRFSRREISRTEATLRFSLVFFALREVFGVLPEFSALFLSGSGGERESGVHLYDYISVMRTFSAAVVLIAGVVWLVLIIRYFLLLRAQNDLREALAQEVFAWRAEHPGNALSGRYAAAFVLMAIGAAFLTDFRLDYRNMLPDALAAAFLLLGLLFTDLPRKEKCVGAAGAVLYGAIATVSEHFAYEFATHHTGAEISKTAEAANAYLVSWLLALAEFLVFSALLVYLLWCLRKVIAKWAGYRSVHDDLPFEQRRRKAFLEEYDRALVRTFVFGFFSALCSFLFDYIQEIPDHRVFRLLEFFWGVDFAAGVLFAVMFAVLLSGIHGEIRRRFQ